MSTDPQINAAFYLSPSLDDLWRWSEDGEVLTWADGTTIAFRAEVEQVLRHLSPGGLPPFGAVALLLAACRDGWSESRGRETVLSYGNVLGRMVGASGGAPTGSAAGLVFARVGKHVSQLIAGLDAVSALPSALRSKPQAKQVLAETVFEGLENRGSAQDAQAVVHALDEGISPESLRPRLSQEESLSQFSRQVDGMARGLARVDEAALANRIRTGLEQEIHAPDQDLSPPQRVRLLLAALRDDPELGGLARLAHDLMAAVTIPRSLYATEDLPAGGVSDLSNRGPLDRLLISELAHDDLTLAVRVAVNEALYLRRESPPSEPPHRRAVLLDVGIRTWGVPRLYGIAATLALACTTDPKANFDVLLATAAGVQAVDMTGRAGVESIMKAMEPAPHPGQSLEAFVDRLAFGDGPNAGHLDAILVTHPDVLADEQFLQSLAPHRSRLNYLATVDRDGSFDLWALSRRGMKPLRQARLDLDQILSPPSSKPARPSVPLISNQEQLPAILFAEPFPLLLPHRANPRTSAVSSRHGLVTVTDDGRLLHWLGPRNGGRQLASRLPRGRLRLIHIEDGSDSVQIVITPRTSSVDLISVPLQFGRHSSTRFNLKLPDPDHVFAREGIVYFVHRRAIYAHSLLDGTPVASLTLDQRIVWERGRFVRVGGQWHAIAYDGSTTLRLEPLKVPRWTRTLFDRDASGENGGGCCALVGGRIVNVPETEWSVDLPPELGAPQRVLGVDRDGSRLVLGQLDQVSLVNLRPGVPVTKLGSRLVTDVLAEALLAPPIHWSSASYTVPQVHFKGIYVDSQRRLSLISRKDAVFHVDIDHNDKLVLRADHGVRQTPNVQTFKPMRRLQDFRLRFHKAQWPHGSIAWLDRRGLLHLKSSDTSIPELSITLSNLDPAAWSSEGKVCGPRYFIGDQSPTDASYFINLMRRFAGRVL